MYVDGVVRCKCEGAWQTSGAGRREYCELGGQLFFADDIELVADSEETFVWIGE